MLGEATVAASVVLRATAKTTSGPPDKCGRGRVAAELLASATLELNLPQTFCLSIAVDQAVPSIFLAKSRPVNTD